MTKPVHYAILQDMEKYGLDTNHYESTFSQTDPSVITFLREYYDKHLPVDATAWMRVNKPKDSLIYGKELRPQVCFVRDVLGSLLFKTYEEWEQNPTMVISTHTSKSVKLPVYQIYLEKYQIRITLRCNFYNWIISINSQIPLDFDCMELFNPNEIIPWCNQEGFPYSEVYGCYSNNTSKFTIDISSDYKVYTFFYLLNNYLKTRDTE